MTDCPVCGYNENPVEVKLSDEELKKKQLKDRFLIHAQQSWWVSQPYVVCKWLKASGVDPKSILDVGCGDGRWVFAISDIFPDAKYTGIDILTDHIQNNKEDLPSSAWPNFNWILGDICKYEPNDPVEMALISGAFNLTLIAGTLNPLMPEEKQGKVLDKIKSLNPRHIVCLFDLNRTGNQPDRWIEDKYKKVSTLVIPPEEKGMRQNIEVWLYEKNA